MYALDFWWYCDACPRRNELLGSLVMMSKESAFKLPVILAARTETSLGGTDWGMLQGGCDHVVWTRAGRAEALS